MSYINRYLNEQYQVNVNYNNFSAGRYNAPCPVIYNGNRITRLQKNGIDYIHYYYDISAGVRLVIATEMPSYQDDPNSGLFLNPSQNVPINISAYFDGSDNVFNANVDLTLVWKVRATFNKLVANNVWWTGKTLTSDDPGTWSVTTEYADPLGSYTNYWNQAYNYATAIHEAHVTGTKHIDEMGCDLVDLPDWLHMTQYTWAGGTKQFDFNFTVNGTVDIEGVHLDIRVSDGTGPYLRTDNWYAPQTEVISRGGTTVSGSTTINPY